jgi:long-chain acyl-CoA synthetase
VPRDRPDRPRGQTGELRANSSDPPLAESVDVSAAPGANLADLAQAAAARTPDRPALIVGDTRLTWADLQRRVEDLAAELLGRDLRMADRVGLAAGGALEFVTGYLAALRAGLIVVPIDHTAAAGEVARALTATGARLLLADARGESAARAGAEAAAQAGSPAPVLVLDAAGPAPRPAGARTRVDYGGEATAVLLETAGTGGRAKRAMLSHRALLANLAQCAALDPAPVTPGDTVLLALPLFHVFGLNAVLGHALHAGATVVAADIQRDPAATLALIARAGVTSVAGTPSMFAGWAAQPEARAALSGVRVLVSGSAPLSAGEVEAFREATGKTVWQGYGLTEAAPVVSASMRSKPGSVGRPIPGIEVRVMDRAGHPAADGDPGELEVRGPNLFSGYWPDGACAPDRAGWYATGDMGWCDADGDLFMVSRRPDVITVSGFPVYPREVEDVVCAHPGVEQAAVVGIADDAAGQVVKLFVVAAADVVLTADTLLAWCAERLGRFKVPRQVEFVADLPRSIAGTIARGRLRATDEGEQ